MIIRSRNVVTPNGTIAADVAVDDGKVVSVEPIGEGACDVDYGELFVMPGVVDAHVHINEPGRTDWEGFSTATAAAIAGGTTTLVDMPLNSVPVTTTVAAFEQKLAAAEGKLHCDVGYWGGVVPENTNDLVPLWNAGVLGFKAFLVDSGIDEFGWVGEQHLRLAMPVLADLGAVLLAHCEAPGPIERAAGAWVINKPEWYATWLASRPPEAELQAIAELTRLSAEYGTRVHVVHLATEKALPLLERSRAGGARVSVETCAHYLTFEAEQIPHGATEFKCAPPIRTRETRAALWQALLDDEIDFITTDHSPSPPELKHLDDGRFDLAWGGIASVQLLLRAVWSQARKRGVELSRVAQWLSQRPAEFAGISDRKGSIAPGKDADFAIFDPSVRGVVESEGLLHRHKLSPYVGRELFGEVVATYVRGELVYDGSVTEPSGMSLLRTRDARNG